MIFFLMYTKTYVVGAYWKSVSEALLVSIPQHVFVEK